MTMELEQLTIWVLQLSVLLIAFGLGLTTRIGDLHDAIRRPVPRSDGFEGRDARRRRRDPPEGQPQRGAGGEESHRPLHGWTSMAAFGSSPNSSGA